jgi:ornithine decarboxylase
VPADRIIYAHPCKPPAELRFACARGVALTTFDTAGEVAKLARWHPGARALLRIRADDPTARFSLGSKYGCEVGDAPALLAAAEAAGVAVCGVAFHVGSGARDPDAYGRAVAAAAAVFAAGAAAGHEMTVLDVGGGFAGGDPAARDAGLGPVAAALGAALDAHFSPSVRVIAEPGRFFAEPVGTLAVAINGVRPHSTRQELPSPASSPPRDAVDYFLSDGVYGSLNSIIYDDARLAFLPLRVVDRGGEGGEGEGGEATPPTTHASTLYGPTCDSADIVARGVPLPRLGVGDFLMCPRASAYSIAGASNFNGFQATKAGAAYVYSAGSGGEGEV